MSQGIIQPVAKPVRLNYEADLCGNIEQALKGLQGYGIMALELIQNADDAGAQTLCFDVRSDGLIVSNDAEFSSCGLESLRCPWQQKPGGRACNFHAISCLGGRSKPPEQIGRFGIGFVSVYQITDTPIIRSAGTELRLNPLRGDAIPNLADFRTGTEFELPWASQPTAIRNALNASPTPPDAAARVAREVRGVLRSGLLFLRHLQRVEVRESGIVCDSVGIERANTEVTLTFGPQGQQVKSWLVLSREADDIIEERRLINKYEVLETLHRSRMVSVAIAVDGQPVDGFLYAYLPTQHKTGMPLHINADFFPHASRQEIVLRGEGHERYWNEALLTTAAAIIGEQFLFLRGKLGYAGLWQLGSDAFILRECGAFAEFWKRFGGAARTTDSVWTTAATWRSPAIVHLGLEDLSQEEESALTSIGLDLLHSGLRRHRNALVALDLREINQETLVSFLEQLDGEGISADNPHLRPLWSAIAKYLARYLDARSLSRSLRERLKTARFLVDTYGEAASPAKVYRMPEGVLESSVRLFIPECPIVDPAALEHTRIAELIREYTLDDFARDLAEAIPDNEAAEQLLGGAGEAVGALYVLLTSFPVEPGGTTEAGQILSCTPFLRTPQGFIPPSRSQLPGGFKDPTGYLEFLDTSLFPPRMEDFAKNILSVRIRSFHEYIHEYLEEILRRGPTREQYQLLLEQIVDRQRELENEGTLQLLAESSFVKSRAGAFVRPDECYYWSTAHESLLGNDRLKWADEDWMPTGTTGLKLRDLLESRLGMRTTLSARHLVDRLRNIAEEGKPNDVATAATPIFRHIIEIERWSRFSDEELEELKALRNLKFLPAVVDGERDADNLYFPHMVYRAGRAPGFASQVPIINIPPLRQADDAVNNVLNLLGVPEEPKTRVVVDHLRQCMSKGSSPSDLTYAILNERVQNKDDLSAIDELKDTAFIYDAELKRFLTSDHVFWDQPPFRDYWSAASRGMAQREPLFSRLGVHSQPGPYNYAALMLEIASKRENTDADLKVHQACLGYLCEALEAHKPEAKEAIERMRAEPSLLNVDGGAVWPDEAIWVDAEQLVTPFGADLNYLLINAPSVSRSAAAGLFQHLKVRPISEVAHLRLAEEPDRIAAAESSNRLAYRADLLLWLAPNHESRRELQKMYSRAEIRLTASLSTRAEINEFDPPVRSGVSNAAAFYERETGVLHVRGSELRLNEWVAAFRAVFSEVERFCPLSDVKPLVMTAALIMLPETREEAEEALRSSGLRPPEDERDILPVGEPLGDVSEEETEQDQEAWEKGGVPPSHKTEIQEHDLSEDAIEGDRDLDSAKEMGPDDGAAPPAVSEDEQRGGARERGSAGRAAVHRPGAADEGYKSKAGTGQFGAEHNPAGDGSGLLRLTGDASVADRTDTSGSKEGRDGRRTRTSRMLAYVARAGDRGVDDSEQVSSGPDNSNLVDIAAIEAALKYEERRGWRAEEQPHSNPGYDIISTSSDGKRRLIEVKGLEGNWTERGIKLSHVQYGMAEQYPDEYWIYVVENARDLGAQRLSAIANPFNKVQEYWFDHAWRGSSEETVGSRDISVRVGALVHHHLWKTGTITAVQRRGIAIMVKVDFGKPEGVKFIPFNSQLKLID